MVKIGRHRLELSHQDKVFFPEANLTKGDIVGYYEAVATAMVPHMRHYGVNMERYPDGLRGGGFYNKDTPDYFPDWISRVTVARREGGSFRAPIVKSKAALVYLANQAVLTPHLYLSRVDALEYPDKMIYDLDPPEGTRDYDAMRDAALSLRDMMEDLDLPTWIQTTGSNGFHIVVPLDRRSGFDEVRQFAHDVARVLVQRCPRKYTLEQRKDKRKGCIFLDTLRNAYGATAVAPYSVRAKPGAPVATPLDWEEVEKGADPRDWSIANIPNRLKQKGDLLSDMMRHARALSIRRGKLDRLLNQEKRAERK
jgi:bifunctional non-homologous end joining protein LigD